MEFKDQLRLIADNIMRTRDMVATEEAVKMAFVAPFINALGYNVFSPEDVIPEFVADLGIKVGEKIDYALMKNGSPVIFIECKWHGHVLDPYNSQLFRYFHTAKAKFGILTNGIEYRIYTDLLEPNKMDEKPFLVFNMTDLKDTEIEEIRKFHKEQYDPDNIFNSAASLKYSNEIRAILANEIQEPSEEFVRHFTNKVYSGRITGKVLEQFKGIVQKTFAQYIGNLITDRIKQALKKEQEAQKPEDIAPPVISKIETTALEIEAYNIIRAILASVIDLKRVSFRDAQSYFSIVLDETPRKAFCRLYFNGARKYIVTMENRQEVRNEILDVLDIFKFTDSIRKSALQVAGGHEQLSRDQINT